MYKRQLDIKPAGIKFLWLLAIAIIPVFNSCSNDLDLVRAEDPVPVVYFRMNPADSLYYLTLTRSFPANGNGYEIARDPDQVYYPDADIRLEGWAGQFKDWETRFEPVDISKNPGTFTETPGHCYVSPNEFYPLNNLTDLPNQYNQINSFRLVINLQGRFGPVIATVPYIPYPQRKYPATPMKMLDLYLDGGNYKAGISFDPLVKYCDLICVFRYQDLDGSWVSRSVTFTLRKNIQIIDNTAVTLIDPDLFFTKVATNIKPVNDTLVRKFTSIDLIFLVSDQNFEEYASTYINAGNLDSPPVGNINNGYGLFCMVRSLNLEKNMTLSYRALDCLANGEITKKLGFVRW